MYSHPLESITCFSSEHVHIQESGRSEPPGGGVESIQWKASQADASSFLRPHEKVTFCWHPHWRDTWRDIPGLKAALMCGTPAGRREVYRQGASVAETVTYRISDGGVTTVCAMAHGWRAVAVVGPHSGQRQPYGPCGGCESSCLASCGVSCPPQVGDRKWMRRERA